VIGDVILLYLEKDLQQARVRSQVLPQTAISIGGVRGCGLASWHGGTARPGVTPACLRQGQAAQKAIGISTWCGYSANQDKMLTLAMLGKGHRDPGTELRLCGEKKRVVR
jgi:glycine cleavage system aminomethyltransferase T